VIVLSMKDGKLDTDNRLIKWTDVGMIDDQGTFTRYWGNNGFSFFNK